MALEYTKTVTINLARSKVVELFDSEENLYKWQPTLLSVKTLSGEPSKAGSKTEFTYKTWFGLSKTTMTETILENSLPDIFTATYEASGVYNVVKNIFQKEKEKTIYTMETKFECGKWFWKLMMKVMPFMFQMQTLSGMKSFKQFAESRSNK